MAVSHRKDRIDLLKKRIQEKILVLDGAMGTALQTRNLSFEDFGSLDLEGCNEILNLTRPEIIEDIFAEYLKAGADIIETNTFGATPLVLDEYALGKKALEINETAARIARKVADQYSTEDWPRFVAGSIGPTTKAISVTGGVTFEELIENFKLQAQGLYAGGADYFLIETSQDMRNVKAAIIGINSFQSSLAGPERLPIAVSLTIESMGTMLGGQNVEAAMASLDHVNLLYLGLNCATGPEFMTDHIRTLAKNFSSAIACVPNAGLPDEHGNYLETPEMVGRVLKRFVDEKWVNVLGGCCGTHSGHIAELRKLADSAPPRTPVETPRSVLSGIENLEITPDLRPVLVGERTNVIGSKKFKELICAEKFDEAVDVARAQVKGGAQIIDVCLANPDRSEFDDMKNFFEKLVKSVKAPFMIDSTDSKVIEMALTYSQGKAIINSINLEDGEERYEEVVPLARKYGAALVVGTIDEDPIQGMAVTRIRKLEVAKRSHDLLVHKYGIKASDIYFDPLVFPCATGDAQYVGSAVETIGGIRLIKEAFPLCKTVLGISNVSFGLPAAGREVLNSVFLYHCVQAGLDLAIVNSQKLERYASLSDVEKKLSEDLLYNRGDDVVAKFAAHFREVKKEAKVKRDDRTLEERLAGYIIEGSKDGLFADLELALKTIRPMDVINGPLMTGMDEVGRLFNGNQLIVAEVLQSAEVMKAAVSFLEPLMEKTDSIDRGTVVLATVKGDVHDIGKNLVDIIFSNNGFKVINLGIKIPPEQLISAVKEHKPHILGLSGLLVKSAQQMVITADDLSKSGIQVPILVGGAALSKNFVDRFISKAYGEGFVTYARDAMSGLDLAKRIVTPSRFSELKTQVEKERSLLEVKTVGTTLQVPVSVKKSTDIQEVLSLPQPTDFNSHILKNTPVGNIISYINPLMLYGRHLGIKGGIVRKLVGNQWSEIPEESKKSIDIWNAVEEVKEDCRKLKLLRPQAVFQFFRACSLGNSVQILSEKGEQIGNFDFPRQTKENGLCLADYVSASVEAKDNLAMFVVTAGYGVREQALKWKTEGQYLKCHILQALALEAAEAYAEYLHGKIRSIWGFTDPIEMTMMDRFQAKYHGKRYSFGYPACPKLSDQETLFRLLNPTQIGVELTEGHMMDPEASVSAIVFHHPQASYFSVGFGAGDERFLEEQRVG